MKGTSGRLSLVVLVLLVPACARLHDTGQLLPTIRQERIPFGDMPSYVEAHGGFMWVLDGRSNLIGKIDPATNEVVETLDLSHIATGHSVVLDMTFGDGSLWVSVAPKRKIFELDPGSGALRGSIPTTARGPSTSFLKGSLWFVDGDFENPVLVRVDPRSGERLARWKIGPINTSVNALVAYNGSIWLVREHARHIAGRGPNPTFFIAEQLRHIDPSDNVVKGRRALGSTYSRGAVNPVTGDVETTTNGLWMSRVREHRLLLMAPLTGRVRLEIGITEFPLPWDFALVAGDLWVGNLNRHDVMWIDPETREREIVDLGDDTSFIGGGFGSAWVPLSNSTTGEGEVVRLTHE